MKKAVMYGAGNIGRGFIGKVFSESGYEVCFLDVVPEIIEAFNKNHEYCVKIVSNDGCRTDVVKNVRAVNAGDEEAVEVIADCDIMASAVGVKILPFIVKNIAKGIRLRKDREKKPLNIILAENQLDVDRIMREMIYRHLSDEEQRWADKNLGLVEASIGRMVPPLTEEERGEDRLLIGVEPYEILPVDKEAFRGEIPKLKGLVPFSPFSMYIRRKLFIHNMGHGICAYMGWDRGYRYIWEAVGDEEIRHTAREAMRKCAVVLARAYHVPEEEFLDHIEDLLLRFGNKALGDTTERVGADPVRKLRKDDRLVGAALYCMEHGENHVEDIVTGIAYALRFAPEGDGSSEIVQKDLREQGMDYVIETYMEIPRDGLLAAMIREEYERIELQKQ